ncbi:MAG: EamA family transporter, partial [Bacilli bacterium]
VLSDANMLNKISPFLVVVFCAIFLKENITMKQIGAIIVAFLGALFIMNIARIMLLNYIFRYHDEYGKMAHDYLFPAIIYGSIVVLWIVWIKFFVTKYNKQNAK